jgi:hypothetical protein
MTVVTVAASETELVPIVVDGEIIGVPISTELRTSWAPLVANYTGGQR